ncbi:MAG: ATP-binding protein [Pyrinomonadaceae bacterium]
MDEILSDCVRNVRVLAEKRNVSINLITVPAEISGDAQLLRRLFMNLLDNAVKYNRAGGNIAVNLADRTVAISDTGNGIADGEQAKIFERFYRTDKSRARGEESNASGAGLGLSIAEWIAGLHHAELELTEIGRNGQHALPSDFQNNHFFIVNLLFIFRLLISKYSKENFYLR